MLETDRLILKPFVQEDLSTVIEMLQDKDFMAFSPYGHLTPEAATTRFFEILDIIKSIILAKWLWS